MIAAYIICGLLILFLLFLIAKLTFSVSYVNDLQVKLKVLFLTFTLYPLEPEEVKKKEKKQKKPKKPGHIRQKPPTAKPPLKETLLLVKDIVAELIEKSGRYLKLEEYRVKVLVATDDPAKTGILYGAVSGILGSISVMIDRLKRRTHQKNRIYTEVKADFLAEEPEIYIRIALSMRVWQMFSLGITASKGLLQYFSLKKEFAKENEQRNAAQTNH
ncbi:MAG TPA: DUF2953 domain-containing protein [Bacillota bacterium]|nr:DUF2953 domain-containing protein [Bacillota bacterium]HOK68487.1 DUF2953 domain-containing protein [Bacillota bacterium]HPP85115.1 DUF2953 domain-containing protein [Bacillota bacterium]